MTGRPQVAPTVLYDKQLDKSGFDAKCRIPVGGNSLGDPVWVYVLMGSVGLCKVGLCAIGVGEEGFAQV